ncbi:DNA polymerase alpha catalytic subunit [Dissostichus eleginoides]|uniref:DNA polymerase alpha catalytic subunit n=1 Tax=Dissostichus eleginoides TaxID=100907 RepID=A0AAD9B5V6_DISEL|nr:DNA polymerase alpha catalytic subunit [Dissostichus eleginoides]
MLACSSAAAPTQLINGLPVPVLPRVLSVFLACSRVAMADQLMAEKASPLKELSKKTEEDEGPALLVKVLQKKKGDDDEEEEEEATPTPPDSSSLSSDNGTMTAVTTEEESLSTLLRHGGRDTDVEEALGVSEAQRGSTDSASFSLPSLSEGGLTAGGGRQGSEDPPLREGETLEAAGENALERFTNTTHFSFHP